MTEMLHPAASHNLPSFITPPGETDVLMVVVAIILALSVLMFGIIYFRLHSLPEHIAHKSQRVQFEVVAVLGLISLFTHMHIFWIAGLLLALIELPDFSGLLGRIAGSVEKMADTQPGESTAVQPEISRRVAEANEATGVPSKTCEFKQGDRVAARPTTPRQPKKEPSHA
jgi:hypothetical protein